MKKISIFILCASLLTGFSFASDVAEEDVSLILSGMEITDGSTNLESTVTRKELAKMLVKASEYATLGEIESRISAFSDVSYTYEGASYIRLAAMNGYMTAYSDGEFKPDKIVKNEEAITATLKLLGYTNSDFTQSYPYEQLSIAKSIKLTDGVDTTVGGYLTQANLQRLIYNALTCTVKNSNKTLAEILGYEISNSTLTLGSVMSKNVEGPVTYSTTSTVSSLTGLSSPAVYINGELKSLEDLEYYDVLYYSKNSNTIWAYRDKVTGMLEGILPNKEAPTSVVISGQTYKLSNYKAQKSFGVAGFSLGNMVTVLLDRNDEVSDAYLTEDLYSEQVGVILSTGKEEKLQTDGSTKVTYYAEVLLSTGETIDISTNSNYSKKVGYTAKISYKNGKVSIYSTSKTTEIYGIFDLSKNMIGSKYKISSEISILEADEYGNTGNVYPSRLDGVYLNKEDVALVVKNDKDVIESMIIKNVTGDTAKYGIIEEVIEGQNSESYTCIIDGNSRQYSNSNIDFNVEKGPAQIYLEGQSLGSLKNLTKVSGSIVNVNNTYIESSSGDKLKVSSDVAVYIKSNSEYNLSDMDTAMSGEYNVSAYYDEVEKNGGRVRVIILS